jgi:hypothetical protein
VRAQEKKSNQQLGLVAMDSCSAAWLGADAVEQRMASDRRKATAREIWASLLRRSGCAHNTVFQAGGKTTVHVDQNSYQWAMGVIWLVFHT